jgi:hypothetical protein
MSNKQAPRSPKTAEWVGGLATLSLAVEVEGVSMHPEVLLWMDEEGVVAGYSLGRPGDMLAMAVDSLCEAMTSSSRGQPGLPQRLRVASPELAEVLSELRPRIEIVCAPTPEIDAVLAAIEKELGEDDGEASSWDTPVSDLGLEVKAALLKAAMGLQQMQPWTVVGVRQPILATVRRCDYRSGTLCISCEENRSVTVSLYANRDDFDAMVAYEEELEREEAEMDSKDFDEAAWFNKPRPILPSFVCLSFDPGSKPSLWSSMLAARNNPSPISADASFHFMSRDKGARARNPTMREVTLMEAILLALPEFLKDKQPLQAAWQGGPPISRVFKVTTHEGVVEVLMGIV